MAALPPSPAQFRSLEQWASQFYDFYVSQTRNRDDNDPLPVLLPHRVSQRDERAATDGMLLYDPALDSVVVSVGGEWLEVSSVSNSAYWIKHAERKILNAYAHTVSVYDTARDIDKLGRNFDIDTGAAETVWEVGGDENYPAAGSNTIDTIVSTSASDTQGIAISGFTDAGGGVLTRVSQTVTLAGTTPVSLSTGLNRVDRMYVSNSGPAAIGTITLSDNGAGTDHALIAAGDAQTYKAAMSTAQNEYLLIDRVRCGIAKRSSGLADFTLEARVIGGVFLPLTGRLFRSSDGTTDDQIVLDRPLVVPPNSDIRVRAEVSNNNTEVSAVISGAYAEIQS